MKSSKLSSNAIKVLEKRYLLKDKSGKVKETPDQLFKRVAKAVARAEENHKKSEKEMANLENKFNNIMKNLEFMPNTPTLMNAGTKLGNLSACYVLPIEDSIESIFSTLKTAALLHQQAAGTGFSFSKIRPRGELVHSTGGIASGPVSFMEIYDKMTEVMKAGGKRRGANMGTLSIHHPDALEFIESKTKPGMLENFNISLTVTDNFMKAVEQNKNFPLIDPKTNKITKKLNAKKVFDKIAKSAWKTGDPGLLFIDEINRKNPTKNLGKIEATNPCGEIPLHPWEACNLGSINVSKLVEEGEFNWKKLKEIIPLCIRFLDNVIDISTYPLKQIEDIVKANRRIGIGVMGFAECLIKLGIPYNSNEALKFAEKLISFIQEKSYLASQALGKEKGSFPNFKSSIWSKKYKTMRNATLTTIAPTGTISIIASCSSGIEPLFAIAFMRNVLDKHLLEVTQTFEEAAKKRKIYSANLLSKIIKSGSIQKIKEIPPELKKLFVTALDIDPEWHVKMQSTFQKHIDNAVSKTINMSSASSIQEIKKAYMLAWKLKCKGITVYRYGSRENQVLTFTDKKVVAEQEFAGGCEGGVCPH